MEVVGRSVGHQVKHLKGKEGCLATRVWGLVVVLYASKEPMEYNLKTLGLKKLHQPPKFLLPLLRIMNKKIQITAEPDVTPTKTELHLTLNNTGVRGTDLCMVEVSV